MTDIPAPPAGPTDGGSVDPHPGDGDDTRITRDVMKIAIAVVLGMIMAILDTTVVNVALPTFQTEFDVTAYSTVAWTVTAYTLALAAIIPVTGWAADRFGTKRLYIMALTLFTLGSVLCAAAWSIESLIVFRVLQGLGGGMLMPLGMTILTRAAGPARMGRLMAILGVPMLLGPILGPIVGGWLIDSASWHWIFLINLPLGVIAIAYAAWALAPDAPEPGETFDLVGMLLMSPGLALFLYGVSSIPAAGTVMATSVLLPGLLGVLLILAFVVWAFRPKHPLLDLRLFKNRDLTVATIVMFTFAAAFFGAMLLVPTYFQDVHRESVLMAGLLVAPQGLGAMVTMPIAGALADRVPVGRIVPFGLLAIVIGTTGFALNTGTDATYWVLITYLFVMGLGMGATMMPIFTAALKTLEHSQVARGSTLLNVIQQVAASVGVALIAVVLTNRQNASEPLSALRAIGEAEQTGGQPPAWAEQVAQRLGDTFQGIAMTDLAQAFRTTYWVAVAALVVTFVPAAFLPRRHQHTHTPDAGDGHGASTEGPPVLH